MTPKERAAMQQALEALETDEQWGFVAKKVLERRLPAITALREALDHSGEADEMVTEQAEQEPVGVVTSKALDGVVQWKGWIPREGTKLYAAPVQQAEQEPVWYARKDQLQKCVRSTGLCEISPEPRQDRIPLYVAPVRTKDMTDDEILQMYTMTPQAAGHVGFARAVIAADRELNK